MTVYRPNPLLMTVMGANPGRRFHARRNPGRGSFERQIDKAISVAWAREASGVQVPIMDIPRIFRDIKLELAAGVSIEAAVRSAAARYRVNSNPLGEAIVGGVTAALVNRAFQSNPGPAFVVIDAVSGSVVYTKRATGVGSQAIASCVEKAKAFARRTGRPQIVFLDVMGVKVGAQVSVGMVRALGITEEIFPEGYRQGPRVRLNPAIQVEWDRLGRRNKLAILEFAGIPEEQAVRLSARPWSILPPDIQSEVMKGWRDSSSSSRQTGTRRRHETTVRMNSGGLRPKSAKAYCALCGEWKAAAGPYRTARSGRGGWVEKRTLCDQCYRGYRQVIRDPKGFSGASGAKDNPGPSSKRKITMTVDRFAAWVKSKNDPVMWRAFLAKFRGYEKWTHGAKARKVTVEWVETPGVNGLWITYDGGKQPESTYIMPKGSPRKGAWKHPWDTMPDIKHDPEAKIVITKLRGSSKITDFYHK